MEHRVELVRAFGRYAAGKSDCFSPKNADEVKQVFDIARKEKRRVAIRAAGHSFNGQAVHEQDTGEQIILSTDAFERIEYDPERPDRITLGSGVPWRAVVAAAILTAEAKGKPIRIPGSMQTGGKATVGGTLSGDCLSRFSCTVGKESRWIESFRLVTPASKDPLDVSEASDRELFHAVIGGHGYIGVVTDATYKLLPIDPNKTCARTEITTHKTFRDLIDKQMQLIKGAASPLGVSSAWFSGGILPSRDPGAIKGAVFNSYYAEPSQPKLRGFPLYNNLDSETRYLTEVAARTPLLDSLVDYFLWVYVHIFTKFEDDLEDFLFFMDGDALAREKFEKRHPGQLFPIVQQTFVVPTDRTESFAKNCIERIKKGKFHPTECDMLFVAKDQALMSGNHELDGFAVSFAFEPTESKAPEDILALLRQLSVDCRDVGGRIHLPKHNHVDKDVFRAMFKGQIERFEAVKRKHDPELLLRNPFSDRLFNF